ncbi:alpha/beta hydrolase family protein [Hyalangium gracile]|uniref:alpha/beta hydrolase family protein n=1 Tax=Hyalangium gracile TaxID=394092 RepID=UPI001CCC2FA6|nr:alpha/beta hydrolase [Hyalangium gracile]
MNPLWMLETPSPPADARLPYGELTFQFGDLRLPPGPGPHPVVVMVHGGFWRARYNLEHAGHLCADLARRGYATWSLEYRRVGHEGGGWPGTFEDVARGMDFLRTLGKSQPLDLSRVVAMGHSAGGHLALWLAGRRRQPSGSPLSSADPFIPRGVVVLAGVVDLVRAHELRLSDDIVTEFLGGTPAQVPERYRLASPSALAPIGVRQVLIHGTEDDTVPVSLSTDYHARARALGDDVRLIPLPGAGHFEVINPLAREWPQVVEALGSLSGS